MESKTQWEKLKKNWLLILQILTIRRIIFALMSHYIIRNSSQAENVVLSIEQTASMNHSYKEQETR